MSHLFVIVFKDEVEDIIVSQKAAERDKTGKAEREKSIMTDQKATYTVLIYTETKANGRQKREQVSRRFLKFFFY